MVQYYRLLTRIIFQLICSIENVHAIAVACNIGGSHDMSHNFQKCPNMEGICYFTRLNCFTASLEVALLSISSVGTVICSNALNFAF